MELKKTVFPIFSRPGGLQDAFLALSVAERRPHTFPEPSGVHFGTNFGFKNGHFSYFFGGPVGALLTPVFLRISSTQAL